MRSPNGNGLPSSRPFEKDKIRKRFWPLLVLILIGILSLVCSCHTDRLAADFAYLQEEHRLMVWFAGESQQNVGNPSPTDSLTSWFWDFGDGVSDTGQVVSHLFDEPGVYPVKLVVSNQRGVDSVSREVEVKVNWIVEFDEPAVASDTVRFEAMVQPLLPDFSHANDLLYDTVWSVSTLAVSQYESVDSFIWDVPGQLIDDGDKPSYLFPASDYDLDIGLKVIRTWVDTLSREKGWTLWTQSSQNVHFTTKPYREQKGDPDSLASIAFKAQVNEQLSQELVLEPIPFSSSLKRYWARHWARVLALFYLLIYGLFEVVRWLKWKEGGKWVLRVVSAMIPLLLFWLAFFLFYQPTIKTLSLKIDSKSRLDLLGPHSLGSGFFFSPQNQIGPDTTIEQNEQEVEGLPRSGAASKIHKLPTYNRYSEILITNPGSDLLAGEEYVASYFFRHEDAKNLHLEIRDTNLFINNKLILNSFAEKKIEKEGADWLRANNYDFSDLLMLPIQAVADSSFMTNPFPFTGIAFSEEELKPELVDFLSQYSPKVISQGSEENHIYTKLPDEFFQNVEMAVFSGDDSWLEKFNPQKLSSLSLAGSESHSYDLRKLRQFQHLDELFIVASGTQVNLFELKELKSLEKLTVEFITASRLDLQQLSELKNLEVLRMSFVEATNIKALVNLPELKWISFPLNTTQEEFNYVLDHLDGLEVIELRQCGYIQDLRALRGLYNLRGLILTMPPENKRNYTVDLRPLMDLKHLEFIYYPEPLEGDSIEAERQILEDLRSRLPDTAFSPMEGFTFCMGSGWILLLLPLTLLTAILFGRYRRKIYPSARR